MRKSGSILITLLITIITFIVIEGFLALPGYYADKSAANRQQGGQKTTVFDPRAIVVLEYLDWRHNGFGIKGTKVAFAIGDGSLLLTAAHCVDDFQPTTDAPISIDPVVISPYYGDVFDVKIVSIDKKADLAILKAPWSTHPAFALASQEEFDAAKYILVASRPQDNTVPEKEIKTELLPVFKKN
jgi:hypothetical protein